jgi:hypothetical protein
LGEIWGLTFEGIVRYFMQAVAGKAVYARTIHWVMFPDYGFFLLKFLSGHNTIFGNSNQPSSIFSEEFACFKMP